MAVFEDLGPILVLPITFLPRLLPQVGSDLLARSEEIKELHSHGGRWKQWPADPANTAGNEDSVFQALPLLFQSIVNTCKCNPTAVLVNNATKAPDSTRANSSRPDGYFLRNPATFALEKRALKAESSGASWEDIAIPCEYKKNSRDHDRCDNDCKIIWSMHHILRNDPCRRFTYGITIENTDMRIWVCNRSTTLVTASFNFITDQDYLVNVVTSLAFAGNTSLGWDPTLRRRREGLTMLYDIDVNTGPNGQIQTFTAYDVISDFGAEAMQGRGTRVFRARDCNGSTVVVKDLWKDHDRAREGDTLHEIMRKMQDDKEIDFEKDKKLFLSVICHGVVQIDGYPDHTLYLIMHNIVIPSGCESIRVSPPDTISDDPPPGAHKGSVGHVPHTPMKTRFRMGTQRADVSQIQHREHYRIVFAELGKSLYEVCNLQKTFQVLDDVTRALMLMYKYGFVHRDVSAGNILSVEGRGVLADLEYAQRLSDNSQHDVRTGTVEFMAVEVACEKYLFLSGDWKTKPPPFKHNALHDIESLWWVCVWSLFNHGMQDSSNDYNLESHRDECSALFPPHVESWRSSIIVKPTLFKVQTYSLPKLFQPPASSVIGALEEISKRYEQVEKGPKMDVSAIFGIHDVICGQMRLAKRCAPPGDVVPLEKVKGIEPLAKRARRD